MKILIVAPQPFFTIRGTPMAIRELARGLKKLGHEIDIATFHLGDDIAKDGIKIHRTKLFSKLVRSLPPGFSAKKVLLDSVLFPKALFLAIRNKYDVVHCVEESAFFFSVFGWLTTSLFTYDMDSIIPDQLAESGKIKSKYLLKLASAFERLAIKRANAVVTICSVFTDTVKKDWPDKPIFQIEDVSVEDNFSNEIALSDKQLILYTGNFEKYQGVEELINGFLKIKDDFPSAELLIVGGEKEEVDLFKIRYNNERIVFAGKRPISEIPKYLEQADIVVSPRTKGKNTPFKIYSYLASGKAILATDIVSHKQVLTDDEDSLLVSPTSGGLAEGLKKLLSDDDLTLRLGVGARRLFDEKYTRKRFEEKVGKYAEFMEELLWTRKL